jgi:hypothetical protein
VAAVGVWLGNAATMKSDAVAACAFLVVVPLSFAASALALTDRFHARYSGNPPRDTWTLRLAVSSLLSIASSWFLMVLFQA